MTCEKQLYYYQSKYSHDVNKTLVIQTTCDAKAGAMFFGGMACTDWQNFIIQYM